MRDEPLITVIVPVFNVEAYLEKCIRSILSQNYRKLEIILVDDGSSDLCGEFCDRYLKRDSRIQVVHKKNGGLSSARNAGLEVTSGDYVGFVDSDDYIEPEMYETLLEGIEKNKSDIAICGYNRVDGEGNVISSVTYSDAALSRNQAFEMLCQGNVYFAIVCNKLFRSEVVGNKRFMMGKIHEDEFIIHHLYGEAGLITTVSQALYNYLYRPSSIMGMERKSLKEFDGVEADLDRVAWMNSKGEFHFGSRTIIQAINDYYFALDNCDKSDPNASYRASKCRKEILSCISNSHTKSLPLRNRIDLQIYKYSDRLFRVWRRTLVSLEKVRIRKS